MQPSKIAEIMKICKTENIPMLLAICTKEEENETIYQSQMVGTYVTNTKISNDLIPKFVDVLNGFDVVSKNEIFEIDCDDLL